MNLSIYSTFVLLFLCNSVLSKEDFVFTAVAPAKVNPSHKQIVVVLTVEEGISHVPVEFNVTINKFKQFVLKPQQQVSLLPLERAVVEFNISKEFLLLNNDYPQELEILISANNGKETNNSKVERILTVQVLNPITPYLHVSKHKPKYSPGETIKYQIYMNEPRNSALATDTFKIKVDFTDSENISALANPINEIIKNGSLYYTGSVTATDNMRQIVVKVTHSNFTARKILPLNIDSKISEPEAGGSTPSDQILNKVYTMVKPNMAFISKPHVQVGIFHDSKTNVTAEGTCETFVGTVLSDVESFLKTNTTIVKEKVQNQTTDFEYIRIDLMKELNLAPINISENGNSIFFKSRCYNKTQKNWTEEAQPAFEVVIYPTNFNVKLIWSDRRNSTSFFGGTSIKQTFEVSRRDGVSVVGEHLDIRNTRHTLKGDRKATALWDVTPPHGQREDKEFVVEVGDFKKLFKVNDVSEKLPHMELYSSLPETDTFRRKRLISDYRPRSPLAINAIIASSSIFLPSKREIVKVPPYSTYIDQEFEINVPTSSHELFFNYMVYGLGEYSPLRLNETEKYIFARSISLQMKTPVLLTVDNFTKISNTTTRVSFSLTGKVENITAAYGVVIPFHENSYLQQGSSRRCDISNDTFQFNYGNANFVSNLPIKIEVCTRIPKDVKSLVSDYFEFPVMLSSNKSIILTKDFDSWGESGTYYMYVLYSYEGTIFQTHRVKFVIKKSAK